MRAFSIRDERGFTLLEVLVAALVLVLAFTALATVFLNSENQSSATVEESQLINVADQQIEQVRAAVIAGPFAKLAMSAAPTVPAANASSTVQSTWLDPGKFAYSYASGGVTTNCYEIDNNYDRVTTSGAQPYGAQPSTFTPWSYCGTYGEPLETLPSGADITVGTGSAIPACSANALTSPCATSFAPDNTTVDVYTFVTDTYVGCGTGAAAATTITTSGQTVTVPASTNQACPTVSASGVSGCTAATTGTGTFGTTSTASTSCADARRVTVAIVPVQAGQGHRQLGRLTPVYLSTIFSNPTPSGSQSGSAGITLEAAL